MGITPLYYYYWKIVFVIRVEFQVKLIKLYKLFTHTFNIITENINGKTHYNNVNGIIIIKIK